MDPVFKYKNLRKEILEVATSKGKNLNDDAFNPPQYKPDSEIIIKSTSIKPDNVAINYTWQVTGWEMDDPGWSGRMGSYSSRK